MKFIIILIFIMGLISINSCVSGLKTGLIIPANVSKVVDGDTIEITILDNKALPLNLQSRTNFTVRLIGIDAFESYPNNRLIRQLSALRKNGKLMTESEAIGYGIMAKEALKKVINSNYQVNIVTLDTNTFIDLYGRILGLVYHQGELLNWELLRRGYVKYYSYNQNGYLYQQFKKAESLAQWERLGIWSEGRLNN